MAFTGPAVLDRGKGAVPLSASLWPPQGLTDLEWQEQTVAITLNTTTLIAPAMSARVYLALLWGAAGGSLTAATNRALLTASIGRHFDQTIPLILSWTSDGPAVSQAWYVTSSATGTILMQQAFYRPKGNQSW